MQIIILVKNKGDENKDGIRGKIKISSTSKIKKISAIEKKRIENGRRALDLGLNPHSKGLTLSLSLKDFWPHAKPAINKKIDKIETKINIKTKKIKN